MKKIGVVGTKEGWSSERLADTVEKLTGYRLLIDMSKVSLDLVRQTIWFNGLDLSTLDGIIIKKAGSRYSPDLLDRLEMLRLLHEKGLPMFSSPLRIIRVLDRLSCTVTLAGGGIPMPPTVITEDEAEALKAVDMFGEAVFKPLFSSKAKGMEVIRAGDSASAAIREFKKDNSIMYIQKRIDHHGLDLGVVFLGGQYLTTYARSNEGDSWNTTTSSGGKYVPFTPEDAIKDLAGKAQDLFGLDFTCVDVAITGDGPVVFEVSAFGGFRGVQTASGLDAADMYARYVLKELEQAATGGGHNKK